MTLRFEILSLLSEPTIAYLVLIAGCILISVEFLRPGLIIPGMTGAVFSVAGLYALMQQPWNMAGGVLLLASLGIAVSTSSSRSPNRHVLCGLAWGLGSSWLASGSIHPAACAFGAITASVVSWIISISYYARASKRAV